MNCGHSSDVNNEKYCDYNNGIFHPQKISELKTCPKTMHDLQQDGFKNQEYIYPDEERVTILVKDEWAEKLS
jgi:hypothetical protein